jgi:hypothetical protein
MANTIIIHQTKNNDNAPWLDTRDSSNTMYFSTAEWNDTMTPSTNYMHEQLLNFNCPKSSIIVQSNNTHRIITFPFDTAENSANAFNILFKRESANELMRQRKELILSKYANFSANTIYSITLFCNGST